MVDLEQKFELLKSNIKKLGKLAVAFSGGVDSSFLLKVAHDLLGKNVIAVTSNSSTYPVRELYEASAFAQMLGVTHLIIDLEELDIEGFSENPLNRCYLCKSQLFTKIKQIAKEKGIEHVAEGSNLDDLNDYRPGMRAVEELGIISPLKDACLTKEEIRLMSKKLGLNTWNKPACACLSSRFPYGEKITREKLAMVEKAEDYLLSLGFKQIRVRHHGSVARIEVEPSEFNKFLHGEVRERVYEAFKQIGFLYITLDLRGYRSGSMNDVMPLKFI